jgi:hypothetical protein
MVLRLGGSAALVPGWRCGAARIRARRLSAIDAWAVVRLQFQPKETVHRPNPAKAAIGESNRPNGDERAGDVITPKMGLATV